MIWALATVGASTGVFGALLVSKKRRNLLDFLKDSASRGSSKVKTQKVEPVEMEGELLELLLVLPLLLRAGLSVTEAIRWSTQRSFGALARELAATLGHIDFGDAADNAFASLGSRAESSAVREFAMKLRIAMARGNRLASMLESQASGLKGQLKARKIEDSSKRENQMLLPLVFLILPVTITFAIYPSIAALSQLNY